jgi:Coenzyme PQQ synthesis protein D (PqqD)
MESAANRPRYRPNPHVLVQDLGPDLMVLHLGTNRFYELNRTAARLWELLVAGQDATQIQQQLLQEYEVSPARLASEVEAMLASLASQELIEPLP